MTIVSPVRVSGLKKRRGTATDRLAIAPFIRGSVPHSATYGQSLDFESVSGVRAVSSYSSHHPQEVLLAQFSLHVHKGGLTLRTLR